ncbi:MAG: DUF4249 domain-containing protein [Bacteroidota bacterium]
MNFKAYIIVLSIVFFLASCETVVDIDVPQEPPSLVVNGYLNTDSSNISFHLSKTDFILSESSFESILGADVTLKENGVEVGSFRETGIGVYTSDVAPGKGNTYELTVAKEGFNTVSAIGSIPDQTIDIIDVSVEEVDRNGYLENLVKVKIKDPGGVANFYEVGIFRYEPVYDFETGELNEEDSVINFVYLELEGTEFEDSPEKFGNTVLVDDLFFNGLEYEFNLLVSSYYFTGDPFFDDDDEDERVFYVTVRNTSEDYYEYVRSVKIQYWNDGDPFAEPVIVEGNINNGFGIFAGFNSSVLEIDLEN